MPGSRSGHARRAVGVGMHADVRMRLLADEVEGGDDRGRDIGELEDRSSAHTTAGI